jgi:DoxX-like family
MTSSIAGASRSRWRTVAYWGSTSVVAYEMVAGSMWDLLRIEYVRVMLAHLGYPLYLLFILGVWKLPCAVVLLVPRFPRLKEWAYAGAFFNYTGAVASHVLVGDQPPMWIWAFGFAVLTLASWALRPPERTLPSAKPETETRRLDWIVPIVMGFLMLVAALLTLPAGAPSF